MKKVEKIKKSQVAVLLAYNPENVGMYSVDLSAFKYFKALGIAADFYVPYFHPKLATHGYGSLKVKPYTNSEQLKDYKTVVFWGDFTTNPQYGLEDFPNHIKCLNEVKSIFRPQYIIRKLIIKVLGLHYRASFDEWKNLYLLADQKKDGRKFISIGQNFQSLHVVDKKIDFSTLKEYYQRFDAIYPRDSVSLQELQKYFPEAGAGNLHLGMDTAFLLGEASIPPTRVNSSKKYRVGHFFHRSDFTNTGELLSRLENMGVELVEIKGWISLPMGREHEYFLQLIEQIKSCDLVISDTYHLLINSLREGTTPFGMGVKSDTQLTTLSDFKKKVLFHDLNAEDLYVESSSKNLSESEIGIIQDSIIQILNRKSKHDVHEKFISKVTKIKSCLRKEFY